MDDTVAVPVVNRELSDREVRLLELGRQDTTTPVTVTVTVHTTPEFRHFCNYNSLFNQENSNLNLKFVLLVIFKCKSILSGLFNYGKSNSFP
jgi:hypothetical protein